MDRCEICGKDWGLLGIVTKADTGEVVVACGSCSEEELRKDQEKAKVLPRAGKAA